MHASGGQGPEDERDVVQVPAGLGDGVRRVREGNHLLQGEGSALASGLSQLHTDAPSPAQVAKDLQRAIDASVKASEAHTHIDQKMYMSAKHRSWVGMAPPLRDDGALSAQLASLKAHGAPTHPGAQPRRFRRKAHLRKPSKQAHTPCTPPPGTWRLLHSSRAT